MAIAGLTGFRIAINTSTAQLYKRTFLLHTLIQWLGYEMTLDRFFGSMHANCDIISKLVRTCRQIAVRKKKVMGEAATV